MKNSELITFYQNTGKLSDLNGVKFSYAIVKNKKLIEAELELMQESLKQSDAYKKYESERIQLCEKHAEKDKEGNPVMKDQRYVIKDQKAFDKELDSLRKEHQDAINEYEKRIKDHEVFMTEESSVQLHKIKIESVPENITPEQLEIVMPIIED